MLKNSRTKQEARKKISDVGSDFYFGKWIWPRPFSTRTVFFHGAHTHNPRHRFLDKKITTELREMHKFILKIITDGIFFLPSEDL